MNLRISSCEAVSSGDDDDRITADQSRPTPVPGSITVVDAALPRQLVLRGLLTSNYPINGRLTTL